MKYGMFSHRKATAQTMEEFAGLPVGTIKSLRVMPNDGPVIIEVNTPLTPELLEAMGKRFGVVIREVLAGEFPP